MPVGFLCSTASAASKPPFPETFRSASSLWQPGEGRGEAGPGRACPSPSPLRHRAWGAPDPEDTSVRSPALPGGSTGRGWGKYPEARVPRLPDSRLPAPALSLNTIFLISKVVRVMAEESFVIGQVFWFCGFFF